MRLSKAVVLVGHGSRARGFAFAMKKVASQLRGQRDMGEVVCAYLEISRPSIEKAIAGCVARGVRQIRVLPYFLMAGRHVNSHIPQIIAGARKKHGRWVRIILCPYLGYDKKVVELTKQRLRQGQ